MTSQVSICNQAIGKLGGTPILNIDQDSTEAPFDGYVAFGVVKVGT